MKGFQPVEIGAGIMTNGEMVKYYTGLPSFSVLNGVFDFISKGFPENHFQ